MARKSIEKYSGSILPQNWGNMDPSDLWPFMPIYIKSVNDSLFFFTFHLCHWSVYWIITTLFQLVQLYLISAVLCLRGPYSPKLPYNWKRRNGRSELKGQLIRSGIASFNNVIKQSVRWDRPFIVVRLQKIDFHCFVEWFNWLFDVLNISSHLFCVMQCTHYKKQYYRIKI